jgi:mannosylglycerate hydrolase
MDQVDVHVVAHTHWDREWYATREQFRLRLVDLVDRVLDRMDGDPRFDCFHLDGQTIVLEDYLEARPEQEDRLRRRIAEGRLLVGPWYVMPDQFLVSGEALVRNLALGHRIASRFGGVMPVGYIPDPFGHVAQMPQILAGFGLTSAILWRGFGGRGAEYFWEAPDGSRVLLLHLPREGYCNALRLPVLPQGQMRSAAAALLARERERTAFGQVLFMCGVDHVEPHPGLPDLVARVGDEPGVRARQSTLPAYVEAVQAAVRADGVGARLETVRGELRGGEEYAFLLPGVLSARTYLKQANARVQAVLEKWAEPVSVFSWLAGSDYPAGILGYAWKTLLQNHPHDSICGCSVDAVHEENRTRFARAGEAAEAVADRAVAYIARQVPAGPAGVLRCLVINTDSRPYSGIVDGFVDLLWETDGLALNLELLERPYKFFPSGARVNGIIDAGGEDVRFQVLREEDCEVHLMSRFLPPWTVKARRVHLALEVRDIPSCGYDTFDLTVSERPASEVGPRFTHAPVSAGPDYIGPDWMENARLRVLVNRDGTVEVHDKLSGAVLSRCLELEDVADAGDEYNYSPPQRDRRVTSADVQKVEVTVVHPGPLRAALRIDLELRVPEALSADRSSRSDRDTALAVALLVQLDAGSPRVTCTATVDNAARDHRLRALFPTGAASVEDVRADTAFGTVRRPARRAVPVKVPLEAPVSAAPLQSFVDAGDDRAGITVFSDGLMEYEVLTDGPPRVALTLLRCVGALSRGDLTTRPGGHAGPGLATPGAQCPGRHVFRFAMEPRGAPPPEAALHARARRFVLPPRVVSPAGADGGVPTRLSFLTLEGGDGAVLSACKKAEDRDSVIVRLFNPGDDPVSLTMGAGSGIARAFAVDLLERRGRELPAEDGRVRISLAARRIETVELVRAP